MKIGERLKGIRNNKKLSINELARISEVNASYISKLERGENSKPSVNILIKLANALKVSLNELLGDNENEAFENYKETDEAIRHRNISYHLEELIKEMYILCRPYERTEIEEFTDEKLKLMSVVWADDLEDYIKSIIEIKMEKELFRIKHAGKK